MRAHRHKFTEADFADLPEETALTARRLAVLLRLSVLMHRGRGASHKPPMVLVVDGADIRMALPEDGLAEHPLTEAEIAREADYLSSAGFSLHYS